jgi:hypothetical protein
MNRIQKMAWLTVVSMGTAFLLAIIATAVLYYLFGFPIANAGIAFLSIGAISGFEQIIFRKRPGTITCDERDRIINSIAAKIGFAISYLFFGLLCMGLWFVKGSQATIDIGVLPIIWLLGGMTAFFVHALTILILYGRSE